MAEPRFCDRAAAGRQLAERMRPYAGRGDELIVLGLAPRGVPVAYELARALDAPLDVLVVRRLPVPENDEVAFGAIASGGTRVLNQELVEELAVPLDWIEAVDAAARGELERRERAYRGERPPADVAGRTVIVVDEGLMPGSAMADATEAIREQEPARVVVAVPVAHPDALAEFGHRADEVVCVTIAELESVADAYESLPPVSDLDVRRLLEHARRPPAQSSPELRRLTGERSDYDPLIERAKQARFTALGGATHGTHEVYAARAEITRRLIQEAGVTAVAVEADWPDAYRVNRFVRGVSDDLDAGEALSDFDRFPPWVWRNADVAEFVSWLREWNDSLPAGQPNVGFYGLDFYSLNRSMDAVVEYLNDVDPEAAVRARDRYSCFDHFSRNPQVYAYETGIGGTESCEHEAVEQLIELRNMTADVAARNGQIDADRHFYAEQNARLVADAEEYYRAMFRGGIESWNLRDHHMAETLDELVSYLERSQGPTKVAVWAHDAHVGDARATELGQQGELSMGQLLRERAPRDTLLVGFTTFEGSITAAPDWGEPAKRLRLRRALPGSWEELFHETGVPSFLVETRQTTGLRLERAVGVVYRPETERLSHYFHARLEDEFDMLVHFDETTAVEPLVRTVAWEAGLPESYPWGV